MCQRCITGDTGQLDVIAPRLAGYGAADQVRSGRLDTCPLALRLAANHLPHVPGHVLPQLPVGLTEEQSVRVGPGHLFPSVHVWGWFSLGQR